LLQFDVEEEILESISESVTEALPALDTGIIGLLRSTFSSALALLIGLYFSVFILFLSCGTGLIRRSGLPGN